MKLFHFVALIALVLVVSFQALAQETPSRPNDPPLGPLDHKVMDDPSQPSHQEVITNIQKNLSTVPKNARGLMDQDAIVAAIKPIKGIASIFRDPDGSVEIKFLDGQPLVIVNNQASK
jgi:hypothetical protein